MTATAIVSLVVYAFDEIRKLVDDPTVSEAAELASVLGGIFEAVDHAVSGKVTPEIAKARIDALTAALRENDAAADLALAAKFPKATP